MASLEQQLADALMYAFDELGGDTFEATRNALYQRTVADWVAQETTKTALVGGVEMAIPGLHALTIPAGISYLLHKMAVISWGIGALKGAHVTETLYGSDLRGVLTVWANDNQYNASLLDMQAFTMDALREALTPAGSAALQAVAQSQREDPTAQTARVLMHLVDSFAHDEKAQRAYKHRLGKQALEEALQHAQARTSVYVRPEGITLPERRIGARLAFKLAAQLSLKVPARWVMGFVPIAGALVNAFFNAQTLRSVAEAAEVYYDHALSFAQLTETIGDPS